MRDERGFALISVLWTLVLLTLLAGLALQTSRTSATLERNAWQRMQGEAAAETGFTRAVLSLFEPSPEKRWPTDGREMRMTANGLPVTVSIQDELGLIDLNTAPRELLAGLFASAGESRAAAETLANVVVDSRNQDTQVPETKNARGISPPRVSVRPIPFRKREELLLLPGMSQRLFNKIESAITVHSRRPSIDPTVAPTQALMALPSATPETVARTIRERQSASSTTSGLGAPLTGRAFTINVAVTQNDGVFHLKRTIRLLPQGTPAYWILDHR